ncbi:hypothetical protein JR316_0006474 [Psilocybe cubensis]|uniref:Uncharacterized protein n=1 Tax=Psilocybe cubensis TaxID=181762 RepID=A0ACB8H274_PSICU|nr:hypothetical protein JR316_0006474 [Psilocybe cubensis]KAH9481944.1 hypothetical protein JR316_0006474 [Psilocybe cubensis]
MLHPRIIKQKKKAPKSTRSFATQRSQRLKAFTAEDLNSLANKIKKYFKWSHMPRDFQLEAIKAQLQNCDVLIHAGTGSGKTFIAAGPHAHEKTEGMVTIMVSPLIALQDEQILTNSYRQKISQRNTDSLQSQSIALMEGAQWKL